MTDHAPIQQRLAIALAAADEAAKRVEQLRIARADCVIAEHELGERVAVARQALRNAAGAHAASEGTQSAFDKARKVLRELESDYETQTLARAGIEEWIAGAERKLASKRRDAALIATDICQLVAGTLETDAYASLARFADVMRRRHALGKLASEIMTEASGGRAAEPIRTYDERAGLLEQSNGENLFSVLSEHELTNLFAPRPELPPATLAQLLELELPRAAEAAE